MTEEYTIIKKLGAGAFGAVYLADALGRKFALKVIDLKKQREEGEMRITRREVPLLAMLRHEKIVWVYGFV